MSSVAFIEAIELGASDSSAAPDDTLSQSRFCSIGPNFPLHSYPNYEPERAFDLAVFINRLHLKQCKVAKEYLNVKSLSFCLPFDSMLSSGLLGFLAIHNTGDIQEPLPNSRLPGDLGVAAGMCRQALEAHRNDPDAVPVRKWWQIIVFLLRRCVNVETIEVPSQWSSIVWYVPRFPKVDPASRRQLPNERYRWGKDPVQDGSEGGVEIDEEGEDGDDEYEQSEGSLGLG